MKVKEVEIHNYKSICSEKKACKLPLDEKVTFLIGANESGKTNVLEAMLKFSTGGFDKNDMPHVSKWCGKPNIPDDLKMVSVTYNTDNDDRKIISKINPVLVNSREIVVTRNYRGEPYISSPDLKIESGLQVSLKNAKEAIKNVVAATRAYLKEYRDSKNEAPTSTLSAAQRLRSLFLAVDSLVGSIKPSQIRNAEKKLARLRNALKNLSSPIPESEEKALRRLEALAVQLKEMQEFMDARNMAGKVWNIVPKFEMVPVNPTLWLEGQYSVEDISNKPQDETSLMSVRRLLHLANLNLDEVRDLSIEMQTVELDRSADRATKLLRELWEQEKEITVRFEWSPEKANNEILIMIETNGYRGFPQNRSLGFRWFLELYLLYATAMKNNAVLLFEEPGVYLHPIAQNYLKNVMRESVAKQGQIVYSTHLPNMYDCAYPEGCRAISKEDGVTVFDTNFESKKGPVIWEVAMQALGVRHPQLRMCKENILTEGPADWVYLLTFSRALAGEDDRFMDIACGLVHIHPCQGTKNVPLIVSFFRQEGVRSIVLLDSDEAGEHAKRKIEEEYKIPDEYIVGIIMINDVIDKGELGEGQHEIEDLFGKEYYTSIVSSYMGSKIVESEEIKKPNLIASATARIVKDKVGKNIDKYELAWHFHDMVIKEKKEIPEDIKERFKKLLVMMVDNIRVERKG